MCILIGRDVDGGASDRISVGSVESATRRPSELN